MSITALGSGLLQAGAWRPPGGHAGLLRLGQGRWQGGSCLGAVWLPGAACGGKLQHCLACMSSSVGRLCLAAPDAPQPVLSPPPLPPPPHPPTPQSLNPAACCLTTPDLITRTDAAKGSSLPLAGLSGVWHHSDPVPWSWGHSGTRWWSHVPGHPEPATRVCAGQPAHNRAGELLPVTVTLQASPRSS